MAIKNIYDTEISASSFTWNGNTIATQAWVNANVGTPTLDAVTTVGNTTTNNIEVGPAFYVGRNISTTSAFAQLGHGRTGNGYAYIDLVGDATYTDYGLRVIRYNTGANAASDIVHRGTGQLSIISNEAAPILFKTSATERMRIASGGDVGIGTTSPASKLHVVSSAYDVMRIERSSAGGGVGLYLENGNNNTWIIGNGGNDHFAINKSTSNFGDEFTILSTGNVGIGTATPAQKLDVVGTTQSTNLILTGIGESAAVARWDGGDNAYEYLIGRAATTRTFSGRAAFLFHTDTTKSILFASSGWTPLLEIQGGTGDTTMAGSLYMANSTNSGRLYADDWGLKVGTSSGHIQFGPANTSWAHIYTDRPAFYFNKELYVNNAQVATRSWVTGQNYLTSYIETDPVFSASAAAGITSTNISNWNTAYSWGDHASAGYLTSVPSHQHTDADINSWHNRQTINIDTYNPDSNWSTSIATSTSHGTQPSNYTNIHNLGGDGVDFQTQIATYYGNNNRMWVRSRYDGTNAWVGWNEVWTSGSFANNSANWNTAYGWGDHAAAGYLTSYSETDTLDSVTSRGNVTTNTIGVGTITQNTSTLLQRINSSWTNNTTTDILYNAWTSSTGDYIVLRPAGNQASEGAFVAAKNGAWFGQHASTGTITDSATAPLSTTWAKIAATSFFNGSVGIGTNSPGYTLDVNGSMHSTNITIADAIYHEGDTNTVIGFGTDAINLSTGGGVRATINNSGTKFNNDVVVVGGATLSLGERGEPDDLGRTVLLEGAANAGNGEGAGRIFFSEHNSTTASADSYGLSLYYEGDANIALPSGFQPNQGNATWSLRRHNNSVNGDYIMSGSRTNSDVTFWGNLTVPNIIYHQDDANTYMQFPANDTWRVVTNASERLRVTSTGNIGIGASSPSEKLQVGTGSADDRIRVYYSDGTYSEQTGWGMEFARNASYLRPNNNNARTLNIGSSGLAWNGVNVESTNFTWNSNAVATQSWVTSQGYSTSSATVYTPDVYEWAQNVYGSNTPIDIGGQMVNGTTTTSQISPSEIQFTAAGTYMISWSLNWESLYNNRSVFGAGAYLNGFIIPGSSNLQYFRYNTYGHASTTNATFSVQVAAGDVISWRTLLHSGAANHATTPIGGDMGAITIHRIA